MRKPAIDKEELTEKLRRGFLILIAVLFLGTALAGGFFYLWDISRQDNQPATQRPQDSLQGQPLEDFEPIANVPKLRTIDKKIGKGQTARVGSTISVIYTGAAAATGTIFQSTAGTGTPIELPLIGGPQGVIEGWAQGIPGMKVGGERRILIPADMAYGANPPAGSGIPPNADLVFDVVLLAVK